MVEKNLSEIIVIQIKALMMWHLINPIALKTKKYMTGTPQYCSRTQCHHNKGIASKFKCRMQAIK